MDAELVEVHYDIETVKQILLGTAGAVFVTASVLPVGILVGALGLLAAALWRRHSLQYTWRVTERVTDRFTVEHGGPIARVDSIRAGSEHAPTEEMSAYRVTLAGDVASNVYEGEGWAQAVYGLDHGVDHIEVPPHRLEETLEQIWVAYGDPREVRRELAAMADHPDPDVRRRIHHWLVVLADEDPVWAETVHRVARDVAAKADHLIDVRAQAALWVRDADQMLALIALGGLSSFRCDEIMTSLDQLGWGDSLSLAAASVHMPAVEFRRVLKILIERPEADDGLALLIDSLPPDHPKASMLADTLALRAPDSAQALWVRMLRRGRSEGLIAARHLAQRAPDATIDRLARDLADADAPYVEALAALLGEAGEVRHVPLLRGWSGRDPRARAAIEASVGKIQERVGPAAMGRLTISEQTGGITPASSPE